MEPPRRPAFNTENRNADPPGCSRQRCGLLRRLPFKWPFFAVRMAPGALTGPSLQTPPGPPPQRERFMTLVKYSLGLCTFFQQDPGSHQLSNSEASAKQSAMTCKEHAAVTRCPGDWLVATIRWPSQPTPWVPRRCPPATPSWGRGRWVGWGKECPRRLWSIPT